MKLFSPDNFSKAEIGYTDVTETAREELTDVINLYFADYQIVSIGKLIGTEIFSDNYRLELTVNDTPKTVLLRRCKFLEVQERAEFYMRILEELAAAGVPVAQVRRGLSSTRAVTHNGFPWIMFDFLKAEHFAPTDASLGSIAEAVGCLHRALRNIAPADQEKIAQESQRNAANYYNKIKSYSEKDLNETEAIMRNKNELEEVEKTMLEEMPRLRVTLREIKETLAAHHQLPRQIIHSDLHPHNFLMRSEAVAAIIDFDSLRPSERARDVAFALYRCGRQFFVAGVKSEETMRTEAARLRELYFKHYEAINPLSNEERLLAPILLKDEMFTKLLFVLKGVYLENNRTWARDMTKFLPAFQEIDYFWPPL